MVITTVGIDLGKSVCVAVAMDRRGKVVMRKRLSHGALVRWLATLPACLVGMEAGSGAHHLGHRLTALGHEVRLMPPQYVRPYRGPMKNDAADALACAEAVQRGEMRFVPLKSPRQLDLQARHRVRQRLIVERTRLINQLRGLLRERGIGVGQGRRRLQKALPAILEDEAALGPMLARLVRELQEDWWRLDARIAAQDEAVLAHAQDDARCRRLTTIPGFGPITASALVAAIDGGQAFRRARDLPAWLGLVPRQHSTGGRDRLLGITRGGNRYLRTLLVHGARAVRRSASARQGRLAAWLEGLEARAHPNKVTVALAAKLARIAFAVLTGKEDYRARTA